MLLEAKRPKRYIMNKKITWTTGTRKVSELIPYVSNPRIQTEKGKALMKHSLEKFNFVEIPAVNKDGTIIAGHQRIENMIAIGRGEEEIDVRIPSRQLTEDEVKEYNVISNRITDLNTWNFDSLQMNLTREQLEFFDFTDVLDMNIPGYEGSTEYNEKEMLSMTITFETLDKKRKFVEIIEKHSPVSLVTINDKVNAFVEKFNA